MRTPVVLLLMLLVSGCDTMGFKGGQGGGAGEAAGAGAGRDMFAPVAMRIHPVSRISSDAGTGRATIEAYVEFVDQFGDVVKAAGRLRFEAYAQGDTAAERDGGFRQEVWEIAIDDEESNRRHFDPITRSYAFKLSITTDISAAGRLMVAVLFQDASGSRLTAEQALATAP